MSRYTSGIFYSLELIIVLILFVFVYYEGKRKKDWIPLKVYVIAGIFNSITELLAEGFGVRVIENATFFGLFQIKYPFISFILGFYEGGFFVLVGYYFVRGVHFKNRESLRMFYKISSIIFLLILINAIGTRSRLNEDPSIIEITRRHMMAVGNIILTSTYAIITLLYVLIKYGPDKTQFTCLFYFWLSLYIATFIMIFPLHIFGIRFIEVGLTDGTFVRAALWEQIVIMYVYSMLTEGTFYILPVFIFLDAFGILERDAGKGAGKD